MRKKKEYKIIVNIKYVPLPPEMVEARKAGLLLLWKLIKEEMEREKQLEINTSEKSPIQTSEVSG